MSVYDLCVARMLSEDREEKYKNLENLVGNTPLYEIQNIEVPNGNRILAKEEWLNPTGSLFDRLYPLLFRKAEEEGKIVPGVTPVIEASTGNAGASFAWCARKLGYHDCTVVTHADTPEARIQQIHSYGAKIVFSPAGEYVKGYVKKLEEILLKDKKEKGGKYGHNPKMMYCVTKINPEGRNAYRRLIDEVVAVKETDAIDYFIAAVGSGVSISGAGKHLKEVNPSAKVIAVDPSEAPVTFSFKKGMRVLNNNVAPHVAFGMGAFGVPLKKLNLDLDVIDDVELVSEQEWRDECQQLNEVEKKPVGRTTGCVLAVALRLARTVHNKTMFICFYDPAWKYKDSYPQTK